MFGVEDVPNATTESGLHPVILSVLKFDIGGVLTHIVVETGSEIHPLFSTRVTVYIPGALKLKVILCVPKTGISPKFPLTRVKVAGVIDQV